MMWSASQAYLLQIAVVGHGAAAVIRQLAVHVLQAGRHALPGRHGEAEPHCLAVIVVGVLH